MASELKFNWSNEHSKSCMKKSRLSDSVKTLLLQCQERQREHHQQQQQQQQEEEDNEASISTFTALSADAMIEELSKSTVIVSHASLQRKLKLPRSLQEQEQEQKSEPPLLTLRIPSRKDQQEQQQDGSLLQQLSRLSLSDRKRVGIDANANANANAGTGVDTSCEYYSEYCNAAARIVQLEIQRHRHHSQQYAKPTIQNLADHSKSSTSASSNVSGGWGLSRRIFQKASSTVTSILASYDLVDTHYGAREDRSKCDHDIYHEDHEEEEEEVDDALLYDENADVNLGMDADHDDAGILSPSKGAKKKDVNMDSTLMESDVLYNVELIIHCCRAILSHAGCYVQLQEKKRRNKSGTIEHDVKDEVDDDIDIDIDIGIDGEEQFTHSSSERGTGLFLHRFGDALDPQSFLSFCHQAGTRAPNRTLCTKDIAVHGPSQEDVWNILRNFQNERSRELDIILATLLATRTAQLYSSSTTSCSSSLSSEGDIVILYPNQPMDADDSTMACTANASAMTNSNPTSAVIKEEKMLGVDVAIFQLSTAIHSHERRMERLTQQMEQAKQRALASKASGNTRAALVHMKRLHLCRQEADKCSGVLLNLDQSLMQLKRARSDAEVVKLYDLVRVAMRDVREENSDNDVEGVMEDLAEHSASLQDMHELVSGSSFGASIETTVGSLDEDDLEKELLEALASESIPNTTTTAISGKANKETSVDENARLSSIELEEKRKNNEAGEEEANNRSEPITGV